MRINATSTSGPGCAAAADRKDLPTVASLPVTARITPVCVDHESARQPDLECLATKGSRRSGMPARWLQRNQA